MKNGGVLHIRTTGSGVWLQWDGEQKVKIISQLISQNAKFQANTAYILLYIPPTF